MVQACWAGFGVPLRKRRRCAGGADGDERRFVIVTLPVPGSSARGPELVSPQVGRRADEGGLSHGLAPTRSR